MAGSIAPAPVRARAAEVSLRAAVIAVAALAAVVRVPLLFDRYEVRFAPDSGLYLHLADRLLAGLHFPSDYRVPAYPALIAIAHALPGRDEDMVILLQHGLGVAIAAAVVAIAWRPFGRVAAITAGVVAAVSPVMLDTEHNVLPDLAFGAAVLAATVLLIQAVVQRPLSYRLLALAGVAFGLTAYVKPNGQAFLVAAVIPLAFATRSVRRTLAGSAVFAAAVVLTIVPWVVRNGIEYDHFSFSAQGGEALFLRVFDQDRLPIPTETEEGRIAARIHAQEVARGGDPITASYTPVKRAFAQRGMTEAEAADVQGDLARTAIGRHPFQYVEGTARNMGLMVARSSYPRYPLDQLSDKLEASEFPRAVARPIWLAGAAAQLALVLVSVGGLTALLLLFSGSRETCLTAVTLGWVWLIVAGSVAVANVPAHRLAAQVLPAYLILCAAGAVAAVRLLRERRGDGLSERERP